MPNFAKLKSDIQETSENDGTEFTSAITGFIQRAEFRLVNDLDDFGLDEFTNVSVSSGNADGAGLGIFEYSVPSGFLSICTQNIKNYG